VIFKIQVNPTGIVFLRDTVCQYEEYSRNGFDLENQNVEGWHEYRREVKTALNCDSTVVLRLFVRPVLNPSFGVECTSADVILTNWSMIFNESDITGWEWELNGGYFADTKDATATLTGTGKHEVTLRVFTKGGCVNETTREIDCFLCPSDSVCLDETRDLHTFIDSTLSTQGASFIFYTKDKVEITDDPPLVTFTAIGDTLFYVRAFDDEGCIGDMAYILIVVKECECDTVMPTFDFDFNLSYCAGDTPITLPLESKDDPPVYGTWSPATILTGSVTSSDTYIFTPNPGECAWPVTVYIQVKQRPILIPKAVCD
jgi:hypothetical protein